MDGRADYCVYWFRKTHDQLKTGQRAGLVGTNTVRQNYTREGGLDHIVNNDGTITEAVSSMIWPGEAVVHVSIVNWIKGDQPGKKRLYNQDGNDAATGWRHDDFDEIGPSLSFALDVTKAKRIEANAAKGGCFQGQTHGHAGFLLAAADAKVLISQNNDYKKILHPFLVADELVGEQVPQASRFVIDFQGRDVIEAEGFEEPFKQVKRLVLPDRKKAAMEEAARNEPILKKDKDAKVNRHHENFLKRWWQLSYAREDMVEALDLLDRYIVCGRVTKRPVFEFISKTIRPNDALQVFPYDDDYSFGILQSGIHWSWFVERCSTLKSDYRYTSNTVFDTFPWPQSPSAKAIRLVADAAIAVRKKRDELRAKNGRSFRELYRTLETPGDNPLRDIHELLDDAVRTAYGMTRKVDPLAFLLSLNYEVADKEANGEDVQGPGLPEVIKERKKFVSKDCLK